MAKRGGKPKDGVASHFNFIRSEIALFDEPPTDVTIKNSYFSEYFPVNSVSDRSTPIQFYIQGTNQLYIDLREVRIYLRAKMVKADGTDLAATDLVAPVNNLLHSLFQQCTVSLNETNITPPTTYYGYRAYIETLLAYSREYKKSISQAAMYYREKNVLNTSVTVEDGYKSRHNLCKNSWSFELYGRPHSDIFMQNRYLIPGIDMRVTFERAPDDFCIFAPAGTAGKFKIEIEEVALHVRKHAILPSLMIDQYKIWESGRPMVYPIRKVDIKSFSIPTGSMQIVNENLITGHLPNRIILCLINSQNLHGTQTTNPFVFRDHNLVYINVSVDGDQINTRPYELDFSEEHPRFLRAYHNIFEALGYSDCDVGLDMTTEEFKNGKQLYLYQLSNLTEAFTTPKYGCVKIELKFNPATAAPLVVLCYAEYESTLYIDSQKSVYFKDYSDN